MNTVQYLAECKKKLNIESDYALAKALGVRRQALQKWQKGENIPTNFGAFRIAEILGEQPAAVIADLEHERAERDGAEPEEVDQWKGYAQRFGGRLAAMGASILLAAGMGGIPNADARLAQTSQTGSMHIVSSTRPKKKRKSASPWAGLLMGFALA